MDKTKCAGCRNPECRRLQAMAISMLESDPEYPWPDFNSLLGATRKPANVR